MVEKKVTQKNTRELAAIVKNKDRQNLFLNELVRQKYHITNTMIKLKMRRRLYYEWLADYPEFAKRIEELRECEVDVIEDAFRDLVKEKNPQCVIFGLKTRGANRGYQEKQEIQHFGATGIVIRFDEPGSTDEKKEEEGDQNTN